MSAYVLLYILNELKIREICAAFEDITCVFIY